VSDKGNIGAKTGRNEGTDKVHYPRSSHIRSFSRFFHLLALPSKSILHFYNIALKDVFFNLFPSFQKEGCHPKRCFTGMKEVPRGAFPAKSPAAQHKSCRTQKPFISVSSLQRHHASSQ
jgi:hypothetical protein